MYKEINCQMNLFCSQNMMIIQSQTTMKYKNRAN